MYKELLAQSPLLALPLMAMALFMVVWVATTVRALTLSRAEADRAARMPLAEDDDGRR